MDLSKQTTYRRTVIAAVATLAVAVGSLWSPDLSAKGRQTGRVGAGGRAVAHFAGAKAVARKNVPSALLYRVGLPSGEPTVGTTHDGNVFTVAIQTNTRVEVLRSKNEGGTWDVVSPKLPNGRNAQLLTFDPYIWVDDFEGVNRIFTIDLTIACAYLSYSDDEGDSWVTNPLACGRPVNDHQTLFSGPPVTSPTVGYPNIVYYCWNDVATSSCSKSLDGGITFSPTGSPAFLGPDVAEQRTCGGLHGHGHVDIRGNVYLPRGYCGQPHLAISRDEGRTWTNHQIAKNGANDHEMSVATDPKGNIYVTWVGPDRLPYLATSTDEGETWSKPMMIAPPGVNEVNLPSLDVGGVGKVAVAYMGSENSPGMNKKGEWPNQGGCSAISSCPTSEEYRKTTWNGYTTVTTNALAGNPLFYSATVNEKSDPLKRGRCGPGRCGTTVYDFIDISIAPDGQVWSSWVDACMLACSQPGAEADGGNEGIIGRLAGIRLR